MILFSIFSIWLVIWFLLYIFNIIKYNPLFILIIAYIITAFEIIYLYYYKTSIRNLFKFFIINIILKIIPIILIYIKNGNLKIYKKDIYASIIILLLYFIYLFIFNINPIIIYTNLLDSYINNTEKNKGFISILYDKIINMFY
jgi:hypothetical protein